MKKIILLLAVLLLVVVVVSEVSAAAYIKFDGIDGESKDSNHDTWSDIMSFNQVISQPGTGATGPVRRRGDVIVSDIQVTKELDKASPKIAEAICNGKNFPKIDIHVTRMINQNNSVYYTYELTNAKIIGYKVGGFTSVEKPPVDDWSTSGDADDRPTEEIKIVFEEIEVKYTVYDAFGLPIGDIGYFWDKFFDV